MIKYYFFIKLKSTPRETIVTDLDPLEEKNKLDFAEEYLEDYCEFHFLEQDEEKEIFELCTGEYYTGYPVNTMDEFHGIAHLIEKAIVCRLYENEEMMTIKVYKPKDSTRQIQDYEGVEGARGYDVIDQVNTDYNLELDWDWDELLTSIPTALNI